MGQEDEDHGANENHPDNQKLVHEGWSDIRDKPRHCTDKLFLLLIIAMWVAMTILGLIVLGTIDDSHLKSGNPYRLTNAIDYNGKICGYDSDVKHEKYGYYLPDLSVVCVSKCPDKNEYDQFYCHYDVQSDADSSVKDGYDYLIQYKCMYYLKTKSVLNRCWPNTDVSNAAIQASNYAASYNVSVSSNQTTYGTSNDKNSGWFSKFLGDVINLSGYIGGFGLGMATGASFLYLYLLRIPGLLPVLVWGVVIGVFACLLVGSFLLWDLAKSWANDGVHSDPEVLTMKIFAYFGWGVCGLYFCLIVVLRKRLSLAIGVVKQASRALANMPTLLALPLLQAVALTIFLVPWVIYILYLASSGDMKVKQGTYEYNGNDVTYSYRTFSYTVNARYAFLYMIFCWFWTSEFILAFGQIVIALSFTAWYFNRNKASTGNVTVAWAIRACLFNHLGTAAFGSLILAIILTIRAILAYIQRKAKQSKSKIVEYVACIIGCIVWCIEKIMRFINKHAYIMTAIYGYSFCKGARSGFFLILRNVLRVAAVNMVSGFLLFVGRLFIPSLTTFACYLCIAYGTNSDEINGLVAPLVFTFLLAYWVSSMFLEIFGMGIETILCCYIADEEMFKVEDRFVEGELLSVFQRTSQAVQAFKSKGRVSAEIVVKPANAIEVESDHVIEPVVAKALPPPGPTVF